VSGGREARRETLVVGREYRDARLDLFLTGALEGVSRKAVKAALDGGRVFVDGRVERRAGFVLQGGETLRITLPRAAPVCPRGDLRVLFRDQWLLAVDKPAGMDCHPTGSGRADVLNQVKDLLQREGEKRPPVLLHRLDLETSGVLLFAIDCAANRRMARQFAGRELEKIYLAAVRGCPPDAFTVSNRLQRGRRGRMVAARYPAGQEAVTDFRVRNRLDGIALVEARPRTGRTHQIRVHLAGEGFPLLGDSLYGGPTAVTLAGRIMAVERCLLHALELTLRHPADNRTLTLQAPPPSDFAVFCASAVKNGKGPA
jgi:RluA family pseudouridine synthase